jgi:hypothetical protein
LQFRCMYSGDHPQSEGARCDQIGRLDGFSITKENPEKLRRIKFYDKETDKTFVFLTTNFEFTAEQKAYLNKNRWQIELFFK